jgi:hypothetical protein
MLGLFLLLSQLTGNIYLKFGPDSNLPYYSNKYLSLGYVDNLNDFLKNQIEIGGWNTNIPGQKSSLYSAYQLGYRTRSQLYLQFFTGVAAISNVDNRLSTNFEFKHDLGVGFKTLKDMGIGLDYSHVSNAGIKTPNLGRDFIQLRVEFPIN